MYVYTPVRNNAGRATTLLLAHYPFSGQPPPSHPSASSCTRLPPSLPCQPLPPPIRSATDHPHRPFRSPLSSPAGLKFPSLLREQSVTASTIHNVHHHLPVHIRTPSFSSLPFSFPFCFYFRPQTPDPIHPAGMAVPCRKYENTGAVSQRECDNTKNFD